MNIDNYAVARIDIGSIIHNIKELKKLHTEFRC